jgi:hypothetical protein
VTESCPPAGQWNDIRSNGRQVDDVAAGEHSRLKLQITRVGTLAYGNRVDIDVDERQSRFLIQIPLTGAFDARTVVKDSAPSESWRKRAS